MELINRVHAEIVQKQKAGIKSVPTVSIANTKQLRFSVAATSKCGMGKGKYIHFTNDGRHWYFIINEDKTGFPVIEGRRNDVTATRVCCKAFIEMFIEATGYKIGDKFFINPTTAELKGCPLFEILVNKSVKQILK